MESAACGSAAVVDAAEMREFRDAEVACYIDFVVVLYREEHHAVDLFRPESGILDCGVAALHSEPKRAAPRVL